MHNIIYTKTHIDTKEEYVSDNHFYRLFFIDTLHIKAIPIIVNTHQPLFLLNTINNEIDTYNGPMSLQYI